MATVRNIVFIGDSTVQGELSGLGMYRFPGGRGCFVERYAAMYAKWTGLPLLGYGFRGMWLSQGLSGLLEWVKTSGTWLLNGTTDAFDRAPHGQAFYNSTGGVLTWTRPVQVSASAGFAIYWIDMLGTGNWQYSIDGGTWTNMGQTIAGDNLLKKFYVTTAVTQTVAIRAFNGTSNVGCCIAGIEPYRLDPRSNNGIIVHNLGHDSAVLVAFVQATSGDRLAWLDSVVLGTNAVSNRPDDLFVMFCNDVDATTSSQYGVNLTTLLSRTKAFCRNTVIAPFEEYGHDLAGVTLANGLAAFTTTTPLDFRDNGNGIKGTDIQPGTTLAVSSTTAGVLSLAATGPGSGTAIIGRSPALQSAFRAQAQTTAAAMGAKFVNIYSLWAAQYGAGFIPAQNAGLVGIYTSTNSIRASITIDHTLCGTVNSTNFPLLISGTYPVLATVANGGSVQNANGYDIQFFSDANLTTKLAWETELYTTSGQVIYWVKIPTLNHTTDTVIYMSYGNSAITTDQSNKTGTWDSTFKAVYHLPNGTTLSGADSTSLGFDMSVVGTASAGTGQIGGGVSLNGNVGNYLTAGTHTEYNTPNLTVSAWFKTSFSGPIVDHSSGSNPRSVLATTTGGSAFFAAFYTDSSQDNLTSTGTNFTDGNWHLVHGTYNGASVSLFVDGVSAVTPVANTKTLGSGSGCDLYISNFGVSPFHGTMDEVRVASSARSASWITAEYNNQSNPDAFYTILSAADFLHESPAGHIDIAKRLWWAVGPRVVT